MGSAGERGDLMALCGDVFYFVSRGRTEIHLELLLSHSAVCKAIPCRTTAAVPQDPFPSLGRYFLCFAFLDPRPRAVLPARHHSSSASCPIDVSFGYILIVSFLV
jgi:hypothetical protein